MGSGAERGPGPSHWGMEGGSLRPQAAKSSLAVSAKAGDLFEWAPRGARRVFSRTKCGPDPHGTLDK